MHTKVYTFKYGLEKVCLSFANIFYLSSKQSLNFEPSMSLLLYCPCLSSHSFFRSSVVCFEWKQICAGTFMSVLSLERVGIPFVGLTPPFLCACHKLAIGFPTTSAVIIYCVQWIKMRCSCSFCWYCRDCWPSP